MSQKREKEEAEIKVPQTTLSLPPPIPLSLPPSHPSGSSIANASNPSRSPEMTSATDDQISRSISDISLVIADLSGSGEKKVESLNRNMKRQREANRCAGDGCQRKLGLMGFRCRCGDLFCSKHRYSDRHGCTYDYKAAGREAIARENPVVKAAKILKV